MSEHPSFFEGAEPAGEDDGSAEATPSPVTAPGTPEPQAEPVPASEALAEPGPLASAPASGHRPIAHKEYYSISEVCDLVGLKPHVLRYWESQFPVLNPSKNRSGNRVYQRKEIRLILLVQHLLYKEKYTIEGARQRLEQLRRGGELGQATGQALDAEMRKLLRDELQELLRLLAPEGARR